MPTLRLPSWDVHDARQRMPELEEPKPNFGCWVGSVSIEDEPRFLDFMSKVRQEDLEGLTQFQYMGGDLVYAVLLNLAGEKWKLVVIESPKSLYSNEQSIFTATFCLKNTLRFITHT